MNDNYTGFEKLLKDKLGNLEYSYNNKDWVDFEKKLPRSPKSYISGTSFLKAFIYIAAVVFTILAIVYFNYDSDKKENNNNNNNNNVAVSNNHTHIDNSSAVKDKNDLADKTQINANSKENKSNTIVDNNKNDNNHKETNQKPEDNKNMIDTRVDNTSPAIDEGKTILNVKQPKFPGYINADITEGCVPLKVQFTPAIISDTISYKWTFGDSKSSTKNAPSHVYKKSGIFSVTLTVMFKKSGITKKINYPDFIYVNPTPESKFRYTVDKETDIYTFSDNSINASTWYWLLGDNTVSKVQNPAHEYFKDGYYDVTLIATNTQGCSDTSTTKITVENKKPFYLPNGFMPADPNANRFGPSGDNMNADGYIFSIYANTGMLVFETTNLEEKWDGKIKGYNIDAPAGAYVCKITMKNKHGILQDYWPLSVTLIR